MQLRSYAVNSAVHAKSRCPWFALGWMLVIVIGLAGNESAAETVFMGPLAYTSAADSPFDLTGLGGTFFLENFEDGALNTPGVSQPVPSQMPPIHLEPLIFRGAPRGPSSETDSVDADDGTIDGDGSGGWSFEQTEAIQLDIFPPRTNQYMAFLFDEQELGFLPKSVGFVWTGGAADARLRVEVFTKIEGQADGEVFYSDWSFAEHDFTTPAGSVPEGSTANDRFFGVMSEIGISRLEIFAAYEGSAQPLEIDHLQYGLPVPEPYGLLLAGLMAVMALMVRPKALS